ncbi:ABC transporter B family member 26, chloroplastic-like isoform X3 [Prosopis cineraria]|uniref:ABC transporter B family member 26, chloroplastic-like isoform X3 n=1 Tax=Prosopis cineraria TaxID=364024 RepID=UPI00240EE227|nr:ABC transporter B family member 26, chloroplastic-like isoform X3 [Prosopis cineraria]
MLNGERWLPNPHRKMSVKPCSHFPRSKSFSFIYGSNSVTCKTKTPFLFSFKSLQSANSKCYKRFECRNLKTSCQFFVSENDKYDYVDSGLRKAFSFARSISPGGSWWNLSEHKQDNVEAAKPLTALLALRRMWVLISGERWILFVAFGSLVIAAVSEISMPSILAASIFSAQSGETVGFYRKAQSLLVLCFASGICSGLRSGCFGILNVILVKRLRENLYAALLFQDISYFDREQVGDLTSRLSTDCQRLSYVIGNDLHLIFRNTLQGTGAVINLLTLSWPLALSALVICSVLSAIFLVYGRYQRKAAKLTQDFTASANEVAQETLSLVRTVRTYGAEVEEVGRYKQWLRRLAFVNTRESLAYGFWNLSFNTLYRSSQIFAVLLGGMSVLCCCVTVEQLTKYVLYCEWLIFATWRVTNSLSSFLQSIGACEKVFKMMDLLPSDQFLSKGVKLQRLRGRFEFVNVSFCYPTRIMVPVLERLNFSVEANEVIAIVGVSGSGKSTLLNLLLRLYEPSNGQIYIDGFPLGELDIRWLRQNIGYIAQEPHLFHMDIKSNIKYGCPRDIKQEDVERAAKQAYAHDFISSFPNGYETIVDDDSLSGGQKQRIAIARAILRDPIIMILDEATSALDPESEHYIKEVVYSLRSGSKARTIIIIAHRLSTIKAADRIFVMDGGRIIEMGNHEELLLEDGFYAKLYKGQTDALT